MTTSTKIASYTAHSDGTTDAASIAAIRCGIILMMAGRGLLFAPTIIDRVYERRSLRPTIYPFVQSIARVRRAEPFRTVAWTE